MINVGEQIAASYLEYVRGCEFIQLNLYTTETQGEIDVVAINLAAREVYVCEVATHLITGLQYTKDGKPNNVQKLTDKFSRDIEYAEKYFGDYRRTYMLWSPIVKNRPNSRNNQAGHVAEIQAAIRRRYSIDLELIINQRFADCLREMREYAGTQTSDIKCPVLRYLQIEQYLAKHVAREA